MTGPTPERSPGLGATVLLVEDDALVRFDLAETFRDAGFRVVECTTAGEGREVLASGKPIDALVTDVNTPGPIDGLELARLARAEHSTMPVVVMSGDAAAADATAADRFFRKPLVSDDLRAALERMLPPTGSTERA